MIKAEVIADSLSPQGNRITTMQVTFPRMILAELNTHRLFSRNSASSRAIPFEKMVKSVKENPFIPIAWQKDHKGMQGTDYLTEFEAEVAEQNWLTARNRAVFMATHMNEGEVTKQLCNRLLEPFMWHTVLITSTEWENFFNLRCPKYHINLPEAAVKSKKELLKAYPASDAILEDTLYWLSINDGQSEIHMMALAEAMYDAMNESAPKQLKAGEWHIPFGDTFNKDGGKFTRYLMDKWKNQQAPTDGNLKERIKIATARCARVSYTVVGEEGKEPNFENDIKLHDTLATSGHWSPFEHCARAMSDEEYYSFVKGTVDSNLDVDGFITIEAHTNVNIFGWCNNFRGFIQYRYLLEN